MKQPNYRQRILVTITAITFAVAGGLYIRERTDLVLAETEASLPTDFLADIPKTTTITDRDGEVLYYLYKDQNRLVVPSEAISDNLKKAIVAAEDERFYLHKGFDVLSVARALRANIQSQSIVSGGSTLTMQLVKNATGDTRQSWQRKAKEAYLATMVEQRYSKEQILALYLNMVSFGNDIYGAETASHFYFNKPASQLSLSEAATLAALPTSPNFYVNDPEALEKRRNYVLRRMVETGKIDQAQADAAIQEKSAVKPPIIPFKAQHFVTTVIEELERHYGDGLYAKGLTVKTALDIDTQMAAEQTVKDHHKTLRNVAAQNVGLVVIEPKTGQVLAMVGSADFTNKDNRGEVNFTTAPLSYGSAAKPLIMAMLLEKEHWSPGAIMWDVKTQFKIVGEAKPYEPKNYDSKFFGPMKLRDALATSRNIPAIKAVQMIGLQDVLNRFADLGITSLGTDPSQYGPSIAVGGGGIPLIELTGAYTALANEGRVNTPILILQESDYTGKLVREVKPTNKPVLRSEVAYEIADILHDNKARERVFGSRSPLVVPGHRVAVKTGTAEDYRSALTVGFTPDVVVGVIVANNNNEPLYQGGSGAMAAAPIWHDMMKKYLEGKSDNWFTKPETVTETEFQTVLGKVKDLTAPWQSPTDRFNKRVAEMDDPLWNRAVAATSTRKEESKPNTAVATNQNQTATQPTTQTTETIRSSTPTRESENRENRGRGNNEERRE